MRFSWAVLALAACLWRGGFQVAMAASTPAPAPSRTPLSYTVYRFDEIGKPDQPDLTPKQLEWVNRIKLTPFYAHRLRELRYVDVDLSNTTPPGPPLVVFLGTAIIVDHKSGEVPCNLFWVDNQAVPDAANCHAVLPSPME